MMKRPLLALTALALCGQAVWAADVPAFKDQKEKLSYAIGMSMGTSLKYQTTDLDTEVIGRAMKDVLSGGKTLLTQQEMQETIRTWQTELRSKRMEVQKTEGEKNRKAGEAFMAENAKKDGVISLPSGLQYKVLASGKGATPKSNDTVRAHYKGTLIDGTEFDSSYTRGQPFVTAVNRVIAGWTEALQKMKVGDKWQLVIPAKLAYGEMGSPPKIPPMATLVFEMELLGIEEPKDAAKPAATTPAPASK